MKKIKVKVCLGTTCYVAGRTNMQKLNDIIPEKYGDKVELVSSGCLGLCSIQWEHKNAPYIKVDDDIIQEATVEKVLEIIDKKLQKN